MGVGDQHGGGNSLRLEDDADDHDYDDADDHEYDDADDADEHDDDADDGIDRWQLSLTGCRYVTPSQDMTRPAFQPRRTKRTFSGEYFLSSQISLLLKEN